MGEKATANLLGVLSIQLVQTRSCLYDLLRDNRNVGSHPVRPARWLMQHDLLTLQRTTKRTADRRACRHAMTRKRSASLEAEASVEVVLDDPLAYLEQCRVLPTHNAYTAAYTPNYAGCLSCLVLLKLLVLCCFCCTCLLQYQCD